MQFYLDVKKLAAIHGDSNITKATFEGEGRPSVKRFNRPGRTLFRRFRRKIRAAEVLSAAMEHLLSQIRFNGKVSIVVQNGRVLKSGYEERYFG